MNIHGGFNLDKIYRYQLTFTDPANGYGRLFNDPSMLQAVINKLRNGPDKTNYYNYLYSLDPPARPLISEWADATGATTHTNAGTANTLSTTMLNAFVNGMGVYDFNYSYWHGGIAMSSELPFIDSMLADPTLTVQDKTALKADAALYAYVLYDDDSVPLDTFGPNGLNAGTGNMPVQQEGYRSEFTLYLPQLPFLQPYLASATSGADSLLDYIVNTDGATQCSPNYTAPCTIPTLENLLQAKMAGTDYFATDTPRMNNLGEFLMQWLTPPDMRSSVTTSTYIPVAIPRKDIEEGDGYYQSHDYTGILAQGLRDANPGLAARLMGAWIDAGQVEEDFAGADSSIINTFAPSADPQLKSANFPGYMSVLRSGWETPQEDASWLLNGDGCRPIPAIGMMTGGM